jgi:hypothetical protein
MIFQIYKNGNDIQLFIRPKNSVTNIFIGSCNKKTNKIFEDSFDNFKDWNERLLSLGINIKFMPEAYALLISYLKEEKKSEINAQRDVNVSRSVLCKIGGNDHYFQRDIKAQLVWKTAKKSGTTYKWITEGNEIVTLSVSDIESICNHIDLRDTIEHLQARKRKDAVNLLTTVEEVEAYDITTLYDME